MAVRKSPPPRPSMPKGMPPKGMPMKGGMGADVDGGHMMPEVHRTMHPAPKPARKGRGK